MDAVRRRRWAFWIITCSAKNHLPGQQTCISTTHSRGVLDAAPLTLRADTIFFPEGVARAVEGLDPEMPYFLAGALICFLYPALVQPHTCSA